MSLPKPYYEEKNITIYHADCRDILPHLEPVDLVVTSPPYNKGEKNNGNDFDDIKYASYCDNKPHEEYKKWQIEIMKLCLKSLHENGSFLYNHKNVMSNNRIISPYEWIVEGQLIKNLKQELIWNRKSSFQNDSRSYYIPITERIFWFIKNKYIFNNENSHNEIISISPEINTEHPAPYPIKLLTLLINIHSSKGNIVVDPFMGSGTTLVAAKLLGRKAIGIEIEEKYCEIAVKRLAQEVFDFK